MKRILPATLLFLAIGIAPALAQTYLGIQGAMGVPTGAFAKEYAIGYGGNGQFLYNLVEDNLWIVGEIGFKYFGYDNPEREELSGRLTTVPLFGSVRYQLAKGNFRPYVGGGLGIHFGSRKLEEQQAVGVKIYRRSESSIGAAFLGGFLYPISTKLQLDATVLVQTILFEDIADSPAFLSVKVGILFPVAF
ncbi:MAG: hypothetical protein QHI48_10200 [Bacteroidota bacterium]|nr:hypothetical protein [Bacteroidota bacterium]